MRFSPAQSPGGVWSALLGTLSLFALLQPAVRAQSVKPATARAEWQYTLAAGESRAETRGLSSGNCTAPHSFVVQSEAKFLRLAQKKVTVVLTPGASTPLHFTLDATGLKPGTHAGKVTVDCKDCKKDRCQARNEVSVALTVVARADGAKDRKAEAEQLKAQLDKSLDGVVKSFNERVARLRKIQGTSSDGRGVEGFDAAEVASIIADAKRGVMAALEDEDLRAAQAYVEKYYPLATNLTTTYVETARASTSPRAGGFRSPRPLSFYAARPSASGVQVVETGAANRAFGNALGFIAVVRGEVRPKTLRIVSVPDEANVLLQAAGGKKYARGTNSEIGDFWPGIYRITVTKSGYVTISQDAQDIGFGGPVILMECKLTTSGEAILCRFN